MEGLLAVAFCAVLAIVLVFMGYRERRTHREEIEYFKAKGWEEAYRFPRHYWWHRETNQAVLFGQYMRDKKQTVRFVEKVGLSDKRRSR